MQVGKIWKPQDEHPFLLSGHLAGIVYFYVDNSWSVSLLLIKF